MERMQKGEFRPPGDEEILLEIREFIDNLAGIGSTVVSDHLLNLLEEVDGKMPRDKERMLSIIDRYFALSEEERLVFRLGRRKGIYRHLDELSDARICQELKGIVAHYERQGKGFVDNHISSLMNGCI
jgi:hypothetical protein